MQELTLQQICAEVAEATNLEEGATGVESVLRVVHGTQPVAPKGVAAELGLPIPLVSAIRRELEHRGWLVRKGGMRLSDEARAQLEPVWGTPGTVEVKETKPAAPAKKKAAAPVAAEEKPAPAKEKKPAAPRRKKAAEEVVAIPDRVPPPPAEVVEFLDESHLITASEPDDDEVLEKELMASFEEEPYEPLDEEPSAPHFDYIPIQLPGEVEEPAVNPFLEMLDELFEERPSADPRWDQSHATMATVLRRAEWFLSRGFIQGKRVLFLGDDDLTSLVTLLLVRRQMGEDVLRSCAVCVVEADPRLVEFLDDMVLSEDLPIAVLAADLRQGLPQSLIGKFDFIFTDPPYTPAGVQLFVSAGASALDPKGPKKAAVAVPLSPPHLQAATQKSLFDLGFVIDSLDPKFNEYIGATMQGGRSALYELSQRNALQQPNRQQSRDAVYTAENRGNRAPDPPGQQPHRGGQGQRSQGRPGGQRSYGPGGQRSGGPGYGGQGGGQGNRSGHGGPGGQGNRGGQGGQGNRSGQGGQGGQGGGQGGQGGYGGGQGNRSGQGGQGGGYGGGQGGYGKPSGPGGGQGGGRPPFRGKRRPTNKRRGPGG